LWPRKGLADRPPAVAEARRGLASLEVREHAVSKEVHDVRNNRASVRKERTDGSGKPLIEVPFND
jgi:hypothetical protein